jgi:hypothetical protein
VSIRTHDDLSDDDLTDDECGHTVVVDGEHQHHDIPDDGAPHAPTSECGCGPARYLTAGGVVYEHVDQDLL